MQTEIVQRILAADPGVSVQTLDAGRGNRDDRIGPEVVVLGIRALGLPRSLLELLAEDPRVHVVAVETDRPEGLIYELYVHPVTRAERWAERLARIVRSAAGAAPVL